MVERVFACSPWRGPHESRYPHCSPWRTLGQSMYIFSGGTVAHGEMTPQWSMFILKHCSPWRSHTGAGERYEKEGAVERSCYGLTTIPHSASLCAGQGKARQRSQE